MICFVFQARLVALGQQQQLLLHQGPHLALLVPPTLQVSRVAHIKYHHLCVLANTFVFLCFYKEYVPQFCPTGATVIKDRL